MNVEAGFPSHCVTRMARSMSARRAVRRFVNLLGVQLSLWPARPGQVVSNALLVERCVQLAEVPSKPAVSSAFGNRTSPTSAIGPAKKSSGTRRSQRSMNSAYWQEVAPRVWSLWTAPPQSG